MGVPKKKTSHSRKRMRKANKHIVSPMLVECSHCHQMKLPHVVCPNCGYYRGKKILEVK